MTFSFLLTFLLITGVALPRYLIGSGVDQYEDRQRRIAESALFEISFHDRPGLSL